MEPMTSHVTSADTGKPSGQEQSGIEDCLSPTVAPVGASSADSDCSWLFGFTVWRSRHELFDSFCRYKKKALGSWSHKNKDIELY
jgi:hypothetical protein